MLGRELLLVSDLTEEERETLVELISELRDFIEAMPEIGSRNDALNDERCSKHAAQITRYLDLCARSHGCGGWQREILSDLVRDAANVPGFWTRFWELVAKSAFRA